MSPSFLYRTEYDPADLAAGSTHRVSDIELASRLSFFLWSSIPDDELLDAAIDGRLQSASVLEAQVRRMIADPRADALVENFTGQWLQLRNLEQRVVPDLLLFPDFDDNLRKAFRRETELLFAEVLAQRSQRARAADRELHVRQRATGSPLRDPRRPRRALSPRRASPTRTATGCSATAASCR